MIPQAAVNLLPRSSPVNKAVPYAAGKTDPADPGFNFWAGDWEVFANAADLANSPLIARSKVERLYAGCAVRESWTPLNGDGGSSLSSYDPVTASWHQLWIDGRGNRVEFNGGLVDGAMVLTGYWPGFLGPDKGALVRMTYSRIDSDTVRHFGEVSIDFGVIWAVSFDLIYKRARLASR